MRTIAALLLAAAAGAQQPVPDKTVVLTFDDAVKSHVTTVAPLLKELGFGATFFITHLWMNDEANFLTWDECAQIHEMGFEIGNHAWTHAGFDQPLNALRLEAELALLDSMLAKKGIPKPVSFAWCGNAFGPIARGVLAKAGIQFARRGMQPEVKYGLAEPGPLYRPEFHDPLLIPSAGDAYPNWTLEHFVRVVERAKDGNIVVLQFHGVPDPVHPWVTTDPALFRQCMAHLKENGYRVLALRDIAPYITPNAGHDDPMRTVSHPERPEKKRVWPPEVAASRAEAPYWLANMRHGHGYTDDEIAAVLQWPPAQWPEPEALPATEGVINILPYPGGRHPRLGFFEGMIAPMRGTKASLFAPWENGGYAVLDLPEAIFSNLGLLFLGHTHIPTVWDEQNVVIENTDWKRLPGGVLESEWTLPNAVAFGARIEPVADGADLELWLRNGTAEPLTGLRTQICLMLGRLKGFEAQTQDNKTYGDALAAARAGDRRVEIEFDGAGRVWGNERCPCIHSDPVLPDAAPGERVSLRGRVRFIEADQ